ncbi:response regulator transcription factor [Pseudoxanthobacter sp. M-2]|uniref:response regulator n=1 Tax=Pseudoxanthobacter sp. M-2 TaxID=3078754 RepID=UPI0038FC4292
MSELLTSRDIVLVVDDSPETLGMLTDALEQSGATVLVATDGEAALDLTGRITPDVILLDAVMPGLDGFETCRRLKAAGAVAHVPVIFMTGLTETEHIVRALAAGGVDYVTKPIVLDELFARIRVHIANARAAASARAALDSAGRYLVATGRDGTVRWCTPQAIRLLGTALTGEGGVVALPIAVRLWIAALAGDKASADRGGSAAPSVSLAGRDGAALTLSFLGTTGEDELLFRLVGDDSADQTAALRQRFQLTAREAEVLLWIARGKANRDIGEILSLSPRTVNKHLEQIYMKLGVENRASAAVAATRALDGG